LANKKVHIIAFDIPYPVNHGGFFDLFYKLSTLKNANIDITLHCFEYGRSHPNELNKYCSKVYYYPRKTGIKGLSFSIPYIVSSRINNTLIQNLAKDNHPIILEGTHSTYILYKNYFPHRTIIYRLHNIEHVYYNKLFQNESNLLKKTYYLVESKLLKRYEKKVLPKASTVVTVSENDKIKVELLSNESNVEFLPVFMPPIKPSNILGMGTYCLYHGNLSISENEQVVIWLIEKVFKELENSLIVAGRKPTKRILKAAEIKRNIKVVADPSELEMLQLIQNAHINIVVSFNDTGIKLKLLNSLLHGRHCIANDAAIHKTGFEDQCLIANTEEEVKRVINGLKNQPFSSQEAEKRKKILQTYNNEANAQKLIKLLYSHYQ